VSWLVGLRGTTCQTERTTSKGAGGFKELLNLNNGKNTFFSNELAFKADGGGITTDLWKEFVKPLFYALIETPSVWGNSPNDSATEALERMDDEAVFTGKSTNELPLQIVSSELPPDYVKEWVGRKIGMDIFDSWRDGDLWAALLRVAQEFKFSVVPLISTASCVPVYGVLNGEPHRYITTDDYTDIQLDVQTPMKIVKYVAVGSLVSSDYATTPITAAIIGMHSAEAAWNDPELGAQGHTVVEPAPAWLLGTIPIGFVTRDSLGGRQMIIPDAVNPTANVTEQKEDYQEIYSKFLKSEVGDMYAKTICQHLLFAERRGKVSGRFRLDIAPGSLVKVQVINDKFAEEDADEKVLYGLVTQVDLEVRAGAEGASGQAHTTFQLGFVRTAAEHEAKGDALTSESHPLYDTRFTGVKLWS
jgi:hypothetical protein